MLTGINAETSYLFRLYGVAILSLLVGYAGGIWQASQGVFPTGIIIMGIVSNGGATLALLLTGTAGKNVYLTLFFGIVTLCLALALVFRGSAMRLIVGGQKGMDNVPNQKNYQTVTVIQSL
ncbi:MAG: hypothetical protein AAGG69_13330 [Pseudomonadota bacterium]